ncbi:MAG: acyl-CoA dehydrogenase family protein [Candidatus Tectomicrobia bacterium]|uniref:Acyl-CoA dehydrogenase family protein n=1 Tax=Tectimicrobiota bacterium TaxID=2528274 RepID=A0A933GLE7_UNCTE|nr:acyl-CoA dehydrogenase family protein [Candidatus Tectomicrobia bacterium]
MESIYLNEEHQLLRKSVRRFVEAEIVPHIEEWEEKRELPRALFRKMAELGYFGIRFPARFGGSEGDVFSTIVLCEELGRCQSLGVANSLVTHSEMAAHFINVWGTEEQKEAYLKPALAGEKILSLGITEPNTGSDVAAIQTSAAKDGDFYVINGSKIFITNGSFADAVILAAKTSKGNKHRDISIFLFDTTTPGFSASTIKKIGHHMSGTSVLAFDNCRIPAHKLMGEEGRGFYAIMNTFQIERIVVSAYGLGAAEKVFEETIEYVKNRVAFGKPIGKFQVVGHKLADMAIELEASRQLLYHATWLYQQGKDFRKEVAMIKVHAARVAHWLADQGLQLHGGYGYTVEYPVSRVYLDSRVGSIGGGTSEIQKEIIVKLLGL